MDRPGLGEFELIDRFFARGGARHAQPGVILGIGDDAALLEVPEGSDLVAAVDTLVAGRHFPETTGARSVGHRALAVNLSDMAAMGATPAWATLALTLPGAEPLWLQEFSAGLLQLADEYAVSLVGGDTTRGPLTVSVQILGHVAHGSALRRTGARAGDLLVVSGTLGDAGAGLKLVTAAAASTTAGAGARASAMSSSCDALELIRRFDYPSPRVSLGERARGIATAAMDLSDGLAGDLPKLARASGVAAHVYVERLPISAALRSVVGEVESRELALSAGDDYELLFAVPADRCADLKAQADRLNLTLTTIGELRAGKGVTWSLNGADVTPRDPGYEHFGRASTQITV